MEESSLNRQSPNALPTPARLREASPEGAWLGGCLKVASLTLGLASLAFTALAIITRINLATTARGFEVIGLGVLFIIGWSFSIIAGVLACLCAGGYAALSPGGWRSALTPLLLGGLALVLAVGTFVVNHLL